MHAWQQCKFWRKYIIFLYSREGFRFTAATESSLAFCYYKSYSTQVESRLGNLKVREHSKFWHFWKAHEQTNPTRYCTKCSSGTTHIIKFFSKLFFQVKQLSVFNGRFLSNIFDIKVSYNFILHRMDNFSYRLYRFLPDKTGIFHQK